MTPGTPPCSHRTSCERRRQPALASVVNESPCGNVGRGELSLPVPMRVRGVDGGDLALLSQSTHVVSVKGAGALGHVTGAFAVQGLFAKSFFFFFPGTDIQGMYLLQAWVCQNAGLIPVPTDMQEDREVPWSNQVTL